MRRLVEYIRGLVLGAKGGVVSFTLKQAKRALGAESKAEEAELKAALEALAALGLLQKAPGKKPRYILQRGTPLWSALEQGHTDLLAALADRRPPGRASRTRSKSAQRTSPGEKRI